MTTICVISFVKDAAEMSIDWIYPISMDWIGLDWVGSDDLCTKL